MREIKWMKYTPFEARAYIYYQNSGLPWGIAMHPLAAIGCPIGSTR
jgi:hypothetical protein